MVEKNPTWESLVNCNYNFREDTCNELHNISSNLLRVTRNSMLQGWEGVATKSIAAIYLCTCTHALTLT